MKSGYEAGMRIIYEPRSQAVIVAFRGRLQVLPGRYGSDVEAVSAGEGYCRRHGWRPLSKSQTLMRSAW